MGGEGRRQRKNASRSDRAKSKLADLVAARKGGKGGEEAGGASGSRAKTFKLKEEEALFDVVDDVEYTALVAERRNKFGDFVVNDSGEAGYVDIGEEDDWNAAYYKDEGEGGGKGGDGPQSLREERGKRQRVSAYEAAMKKKPKKSQVATLLSEAANQTKKLDKMFLAATAVGPKGASAAAAAQAAGAKQGAGAGAGKLSLGQQLGQSSKSQHMEGQADALLEDILGDLDANAIAGSEAAGAQRNAFQRRPTPVRKQPPVMVSPRPAASFAPAATKTPVKGRSVQFLEPVADEDPANYLDSAPSAAGDAAAAAAEPEPMISEAKGEGEAAAGPVAMETEEAGEAARQEEEQGSPATPNNAGFMKSAWESMCEGGQLDSYLKESATDSPATTAVTAEGSPAAMAAPGAQTESEEGAAAPLESLDFYFLDLHSEGGASSLKRGNVYLFGKVSDGKGGWQSCSVVVKNMQRNVFFVPNASLLSDEHKSQIEALEARIKEGENKARGELMRLLHGAFSDLKDEVRGILTRSGVSKFTLVPVKRDYAFEVAEIPRRVQWVIKVKYSAQLPELRDYEEISKGGRHFCAILGARTSISEHLILKRKVKGPSWLRIRSPRPVDRTMQVTWSKLEFEVDSPKDVTPATKANETPKASGGGGGSKSAHGAQSHPPLTVAAVNIKTHMVGSTPEIVSCTVMYLKQVQTDLPTPKDQWNTLKHLRHFSCVRRLDGRPFPIGFEDECKRRNQQTAIGKLNGNSVLSSFNSERALLCNVIARIKALDPDVIVGHNVLAYDLDILYSRMLALKVPHWSRIGRMKRSSLPFGSEKKKGSNFGNTLVGSTITTGRLVCDTYLSAREFVRQADYSLKSLSSELLKEQKVEMKEAREDMGACFETKERLLQLVTLAEQDTWLALGLMFHLSILPLTRQLTNLSGFQWTKVLRGGRAQRIEYLLLHEFHQKKFMVPDRKAGNLKDGQSGKRGKAQFAGGLVLEPKCGLYDDVVMMLDFNSLYPSIIQEYNICWTTQNHLHAAETAEEGGDGGPALSLEGLTGGVVSGEDLAVLPSVIRRLVLRRRQVKALLKEERDESKKQQLDIRQQALKLTANSMYGCLGFSASRFCAKPLAELVTAQGREILQNTANLAEQTLGLEVVYGDTDSIFVNTRSKDIREVKMKGAQLRKEVNKRYKMLEIEIDAIYERLLLLKKKKYAGVKLGGELELKGVDLVRRDWSVLAKKVGTKVLNMLLRPAADEDKEATLEKIHEYMEEVGKRVRLAPGKEDAFPLECFVIRKGLTKDPAHYPDAKNQPHVQVAMRKGLKSGATVPYVIAAAASNGEAAEAEAGGSSIAARAFHPEEMRADAKAKKAVDITYYLSNQIHPVVSRLLFPIEGTSAARIAQQLGLDAQRYYQQDKAKERETRDDALCFSIGQTGKAFPVEASIANPNNGSGANKPSNDSAQAQDAAAGSGTGVGAALTDAQARNKVALALHGMISEYYEPASASDNGAGAGAEAAKDTTAGTSSTLFNDIAYWQKRAEELHLPAAHQLLQETKAKSAFQWGFGKSFWQKACF